MTLSRLIRISGQRLRSASHKDDLDAELNRELAFHFELLVKENVAEGMTQKEAEQAARRALGNVPLLEEECRDQRRMSWLHDLVQDLAYGFRMLRKSPGFTALAAASLALGIGGNAAIFGVIDRVVEGNLPIPKPDGLVVIRTFPLENPQQRTNASVPDFIGWKERNRSFESIGASIANHEDFDAERDGEPSENILGQGCSPGLFQALGVQPILGRTFAEEEDQIGAPAHVMVISHELWQRRFGEDPSVLGREVRLNNVPHTIVGVMPEGFWYPLQEVEYWIPLHLTPFQLQGSARFFTVAARLKPGVSIPRAQAEMDAIASQLGSEIPSVRGWGVRLQPMREYFLGWTTVPVLTLGSAVALVLLIACANVAALLLARGSSRMGEMKMRVALGASRGRIIRQLLTESVLLSTLGGALGVLIADWGLRGLVALNPPPEGMRIGALSVNGRMVVLSMVLAILAGLAFGIAPALTNFKMGPGAHYNRHRLRSTLVASQIAIALMLLIGSGLLINSLIRVALNDLNFDPDRLLSFNYRMPIQQYLRSLGVFHGAPYNEVNPPPYRTLQRLFDRLSGMPGVESVAGSSTALVNSLVLPTMNFAIEGRPRPEKEVDRDSLNAVYFLVTQNFFTSIKTPFVRGRDFQADDIASSPWVAVINETMARQYWPGEDPIGKRITLDVVAGEQPREIVGVVRDIPLRRVYEPRPVIYASYLQQAERYQGPNANMFGNMTFLIRSSGDPMTLVPAVRQAVSEIDPGRALSDVVSVDDFLGNQLQTKQRYVTMLGVFAFVATLLAAIGIYGVMAYSVAQRTREIGVRMALGASARDIVLSVGRQALVLIAAGLVLGLAGSFALTRLIASQLWGVTATDPATFAGVTLLLVFVALMACFVPARRAARVDPTVALRSE